MTGVQTCALPISRPNGILLAVSYSTLYSPQRVNYNPTQPNANPDTDPRKVLLATLKKLGDKKTMGMLDQSPAAVMGAVTNPSDVASGMRANPLTGFSQRVKAFGG